jgi:beta-mannanase
LEDSLQTQLPVIHIYTAWGSKKEHRFPKKQFEAIYHMGSVPLLTWEPWLTAFEDDAINGLRDKEVRDIKGLADIANGTYDTYIRQWAKAAAKFAKPFYLRFAHEMNDPYRYPWGPQNNSSADFIAAWKHVKSLFVSEGANNAIWIWSPHPAYGQFNEFYPGNDMVDMVGIGALNYGNVATWSQWWSFDDIFGKHYAELDVFQKPMLISEFGSLKTGGDRADWFADALLSIKNKYPSVKALVFYHNHDDHTTTQQSIDWSITHDSRSIKAIRTAISPKKAFTHSHSVPVLDKAS